MQDMAETSRSTIIAAIIGVIGSIAVALITNWDKLAGPRHPDTPPGQSPAPVPVNPVTPLKDSVASVINIAGNWRDSTYPANGSRITQQGTAFEFKGWGVLPQGIPFDSTGNGSVSGQQVTSSYTTTYQNGLRSSGSCTGTVSPDGSRMTSTCTDSLLGTFVNSGVKQ